jgi:NTE family protein
LPISVRSAAVERLLPVTEPERKELVAVSDLHQADAVFQGGGVKGIALVGALLAFAEAGWTEWVSIAGTSAGSIVAGFLGCGYSPADLEKILRTTPYAKFEDFGPGGQVIGGGINLVAHHGLAHGDAFHEWFGDMIEHQTFGDVAKRGKTLKMIAADITQKEMLVLPDDLANYLDPKTKKPIVAETFKVADAVRMSMSIPFFFQPVELVHAATGKTSTIVDGGMLSNFPVWLFDVDDRAPKRPTFGFRLYGGKSMTPGGLHAVMQRVAWPVAFGFDMFGCAMEAWDKRFMSHSTRVRTCAISAVGVGTVDFALTDDDQTRLLDSGKQAGHEFLESFRVEDYFNTFGKKLEPVAVPA